MKRVLVALLLAGCGVAPTSSRDRPDHPFDPGAVKTGGYGSGSGSGSGSSSEPPPPPMCEASLRRCAHEFVYYGKGDEKSVEVRGSFDNWGPGRAMALSAGAWRATVEISFLDRSVYKFRIINSAGAESWIVDPANPNSEDDGLGGKNSVLSAPMCAEFSCTTPVVGSYDWRDAVLYFVLVDRFLDGDPSNNRATPNVAEAANFRGGDWQGVIQKINEGWFAQLGVNALWLSVPLDNTEASGLGDDGALYSAFHGYWPRDLGKPDARLGSSDELKALVDAAHQKGIRVLIDYAMNHVHKDSPIFQAHQNDGWFNPLLVNGQECVCGSNVCQWESPAKISCWFRNYLPDFNFAHPDARKFSVDNALYWVKTFGFDGLRLDAVKHIELSWLTDFRARLTAEVEPVTKQHVYLVGETFTGDQQLIKSFVDPARMLDGQFDFPLRANLVSKVLLRQGSMRELADFMDRNTTYYGNAVMSTFVGNHDVPRSIHFAEDAPLWQDAWAGGKDRNWSNQPGVVGGTAAYERLALAMAVTMTNRGVPLLYYGDEVGLPGAGDPDNRRMMQWSGWSTGQQLLFDRMKALGAARAAHPALRRGTRTTISVDSEVWAYSMVDGADTVYVALNRSDGEKSVSGLPASALKDLVSGATVNGPTLNLPARGVRILVTP